MSNEESPTRATSRRGYAMAAGGTLLFTSINVWTGVHDGAASPLSHPAWRMACWEYTSAAMILILLPLVGRIATMAMAPTRWRLPRAAAILAAGWILFMGLHVGGFVLLRKSIYACFGAHYQFCAGSSWLYEAPKDVGTYLILIAVLTLSRRPAAPAAAPSEPQSESTPELFAIREGRRIHHVRPSEIVAVNAAGNYVEFWLVDGRKPLMRATLSAVSSQIPPPSLVRTHRSWLVNPTSVREIAPASGGDRRLILSGNIEAPLSRRYPDALTALHA